MAQAASPGKSLYALLGSIIVAVVCLVLGAQATYDYLTQREQMIEQMRRSSAMSIAALQKNIAGFIEAYSVNEYQSLIETEINLHQHFAIVVSDYNMGKILGKDAFVSGKIRDPAGNIVDYNPAEAQHRQWLDKSFYGETSAIVSATGTDLGWVAIYITDEAMQQKLREILIERIIATLVIALLLITLILLAVKRLLVRPLARLATVLEERDEDGIPTAPIPGFAYREIAVLTDTMQTMIEVVRRSRASLHAEHDSLLRSLQRNQEIQEELTHHRDHLEEVVTARTAELAKAKDALATSVKERRKYELDVEQWKEKVRKYKDQIYEVKTNEAYKALQHEIQAAEAEITKAEDRLL